LLNTSALKEAFYQSVSDTSFYQTFNLDDMDGAKAELSVSEVLLGALAASLSGEKYEVTAEGILASGKCTTPGTPSCVYSNGNLLELFTYNGIYVPQLDNRYNITDANRNPAKYLIQAESLGSYSDSLGLTSYFRDYWNRESTFQNSKEFLYELNRWVYDNDARPTTEQIVYPEAFVKPVSFVQDFLRINTDSTSSSFGKEYVYVTERVTMEDITNASSGHDVNATFDAKHIVEMFNQDDFLTKSGELRYSKVVWNFYISESFGADGHGEKLFSTLYWVMDLKSFDANEDFQMYIYRPDNAKGEEDAKLLFGEKNLQNVKGFLTDYIFPY
jgi:hypothetical protein